MTVEPQPINLLEFEALAEQLLPKHEFDYIAGGVTDEISVRRNRRAFEAIALRPRVLTDVSELNLSTTVLGTEVSLPVLIAPCGGHKKAHPDGEIATYRATTECGTILNVSANSSVSFEELADAATGPLWFQLYPFRDRELTTHWIERSSNAGYAALCVTLDSQWPPKRERGHPQRLSEINWDQLLDIGSGAEPDRWAESDQLSGEERRKPEGDVGRAGVDQIADGSSDRGQGNHDG